MSREAVGVPAIEAVAVPPILLPRPPVFAPDDRANGEAPKTAPRILIVEDDYLVAIELEAGLAEAGFAVAGTATTATEAIELAKAERPTLIVMDVRLAGKRDGIEAALAIYQATGIRSIFATAHAEPPTRARASAAAPLGWLVKPYQIGALIVLIREALGDLQL